MNRKSESESKGFEEIAEWLRSERPPFSESDRAEMRRAVWREIEARPQPRGVFEPARLFAAGATVLAAVLVAVLWLRPVPSAPSVPASAAIAATPAPVGAAAERPQAPVEETFGPPAIGHIRPSARPRRTQPEGVPVRIEFQTANPEVRIIWLVKKGEAAPRPFSAGRHQEVS